VRRGSGNEYFLAELMECFGEPASDAGTAAGDENGIAGEFHDFKYDVSSDNNVVNGNML
jgi:hypothetical protein